VRDTFIQLSAILLGLVAVVSSPVNRAAAATGSSQATSNCPENAGIVLSPGFCATVFADNLGHARHLAVAPNGVVYVNTWSRRSSLPAPQVF